MEYFPDNEIDEDFAKQKLSKATRAFMERSRVYEGMISSAREEYNIGMRHLANMMGENPETFTQADANVCDIAERLTDLVSSIEIHSIAGSR